jgi:hypothetical protein
MKLRTFQEYERCPIISFNVVKNNMPDQLLIRSRSFETLCPIHSALFAEWMGGSVAFLWDRSVKEAEGRIVHAGYA